LLSTHIISYVEAAAPSIALINRGRLLNAAWIGTLLTLTLSFCISLIWFYVVRGNVQQDRQTGVGQILVLSELSASFSEMLLPNRPNLYPK